MQGHERLAAPPTEAESAIVGVDQAEPRWTGQPSVLIHEPEELLLGPDLRELPMKPP